MTGLFDWEMTTIGDPLADLGAAMSYWMEEDDPEPLKKEWASLPLRRAASSIQESNL